MLLLESPAALPLALSRYLADIQPAYGSTAVSAGPRRIQSRLVDRRRSCDLPTAQAEIDTLLEISPRRPNELLADRHPDRRPTNSRMSQAEDPRA